MAALCTRFGFQWHGRIAAAYIEAETDVFRTRELSSSCGLYSDQIALAHHTGFLNSENSSQSHVAAAVDSLAASGASDEARTGTELQKSGLHTATYYMLLHVYKL